MEKLPSLKPDQARHLMVYCMGLAGGRQPKAKKADLLKVIRQINGLQLDTISIMARAHFHILYSRLGPFKTEWLEEVHAEGQLFEYFAHAMSFLPIEDFPLYWSEMQRRGRKWAEDPWVQQRQAGLAAMLDYVRENGPVKSADFKGKRSGPWWGWKEEKGLLEVLFYRGDLMIPRREGFQRVYDLRERVLPHWREEDALSASESAKERLLQAARLLGVASDRWLARQTYLINTKAICKGLLEEGRLLSAGIDGLQQNFYIHPDNLSLYEGALAGKLKTNSTKLLSMFDPLMVDRDRVKALFNFDYKIQVYVPKAQRIAGYYLLPILHRGNLVGRLDGKAFRKEKRLQIYSIYLEEGQRLSFGLAEGLAKELLSFAAWLGLDELKIEQVEPVGFKTMLEDALCRRSGI